MALATNLVAAGLLAFTIFFYAVVYTLWLKRSTPQNIVIGGLAGALPPVIGWAAASGTTPLNAWLLCAIIFLWTPPHFWALSLYTKDDYAAAGVPMLPVVKGAAATRRTILVYSLVLVALAQRAGGDRARRRRSISPSRPPAAWSSSSWPGGWPAAEPAMTPAAPSGLYQVKGPKEARDLFAFSIVYLFLLFAALLAERFIGLAPLIR